jgi:hypothetical protein
VTLRATAKDAPLEKLVMEHQLLAPVLQETTLMKLEPVPPAQQDRFVPILMVLLITADLAIAQTQLLLPQLVRWLRRVTIVTTKTQLRQLAEPESSQVRARPTVRIAQLDMNALDSLFQLLLCAQLEKLTMDLEGARLVLALLYVFKTSQEKKSRALMEHHPIIAEAV